MKKTIKISLITVAFLSSLHAQESIVLEPLTVDSTAIKTDELKSTDAVEIYTASDIQKAHVQNLYEFLNEQTSVITMPSYGNPFTQLIDFHGYGTSNGNQNVVITLDGRKINNIDTVPQLLSGISTDSIERIEIIKSSGIVTAGDGANAGVINIITKKNSNEKSVSFYGGTYGVVDGAFNFGHSDDKLSIFASGEAQKFDGIRTIDENGGKDASKLSNGALNITYQTTDDLELHGGASFSRTDVTYGGTMKKAEYDNNPFQQGNGLYGPSSSVRQLLDTDAINGGIFYQLNYHFSFHIDANSERKKSTYVGGSPYYYTYNSVKTSLDYMSDVASVTFGYDGFFGDRKDSSSTTKKNNNALFAMSQFYWQNATFKAGYRFENVEYQYNDSATNLSQSKILHGVELGFNYTFDKQNSLFIDYSHSYQAPAIDMFFATDYTFWPTTTTTFNSFIKPMEADNYTIGYNNIQKNNKFKISAFYIDLKNEIYLYKAYVGDFGTNTNLDKSHKYGVDLFDNYIVNENFNLSLNYNYVEAIIDKEKYGADDYSGNKLPALSNHNIKTTLNYLPNERTTFSLAEVYRSQAYSADDIANNASQKQDAFLSTDISATYSQKNWEIFAKINNLFNQKNGLWSQDDAIYPLNYTTTAIAGFKLKF